MGRIKKGIVLAAGDGDRLGRLTRDCPKVLLPAPDGGPLIGYPIRALVAAGISDIAVVTGYLGHQVEDTLGDGREFGVRLEYICNPEYLGGNAFSVHCARRWVGKSPAVLCMGDHLIDREMVRRLVGSHPSGETLCVDHAPSGNLDFEEATKVAVDRRGCIVAIGKELVHWDALDTGVFLLKETFFRVLDELVQQRGAEVEMSHVIRCLVGQGYRFHTCDTSSCAWMDVDTEEDLSAARA